MTAHLPKGFWKPIEEATDEQVKTMAEFVLAYKEYGGGTAYTVGVFVILSPADQVVFTAGQLLDLVGHLREDEGFQELLDATVTAACEEDSEDSQEIGIKAIVQTVSKVIALEAKNAEDSPKNP